MTQIFNGLWIGTRSHTAARRGEVDQSRWNGVSWSELRHEGSPASVSKDQTEDAMRRDFLVISAGVLAVYAALSMFWSSPEKPPRAHTIQQIDAAPELKLVSEQSPYMRTER